MKNRGKNKTKLNSKTKSSQKPQKRLKKNNEKINLTNNDLKEYKSEINALLEILDGDIAVINKKGKFLKFLKKNNRSKLGIILNDKTSKTIFDVFPETQATYILDKVEKALLRKKILSFSQTFTANKKKYSFDFLISPVKNNRVILIAENITKKKQIDQIDNRSKRLFRTIWDMSADGMRLTDSDGIMIMVNDAFSKMVKKKKEELVGKPLSVIYGDNKSSDIIKKHKERFKDRTLLPYLENEYTLWNGENISFGVSNSFFKFENKVPYALAIFRDITKRKEADQKLTLTFSLLNATLESTADGLLVVDQNGKITGYNQKFLKMWNIPQEIILGGNDEKALGYVNSQLKDPKAFLEQVKYLYDQPELESFDLLEFKDGRFFERNSIPQKLNNKTVGRVWSFRDVTWEKKSEEALIESEKRFRILFEDSAEAICIMTDKFEECNEQLCNLFECSREDIINHSPWEFSPEKQPDGKNSRLSALEKINAALEDKPQYFYWQHISKNGKLIDAEVSLNGFVLGGKKLVQATIHDITERKKFEEIQTALYKISESVNTTKDMQTLFSKIHEVIKGLMSAENFYIALYDEKTDMLSFPYFVDEVDSPPPPRKLGKGLTDYVLRTGKEAIIREKEEIELKKNNEIELVGSYSPVWVGVPLKLEGKTLGVMVVQDYHYEYAYTETEKQILVFVSEQSALAINRKKTSEELINYTKRLTESKDLLEQRASQLAKLNKQLAESEKKLKELNASKDKLFSIIAHDLKGPFQPLLGMSEILASEQFTLNEKEKDKFIKEIYGLLKNQFKLVDNILDWARMQTGRQQFNPLKINVFEKVNEVATILSANALNKNISITNNVENDAFVFADSYMLQSILQNLISNAIKFTNIDGNISITSENVDSCFHITVSDNGVGISNEEIQKIFRIDTQHSTLGTENEKGTGLGLIICKEMLEKNGGKIWVESKLGEGSKFIFTLPKCPDD